MPFFTATVVAPVAVPASLRRAITNIGMTNIGMTNIGMRQACAFNRPGAASAGRSTLPTARALLKNLGAGPSFRRHR